MVKYYTTTEIKRIAELAKEGKTIREAAHIIGRSKDSVAWVASQNEIRFNGQRGPKFSVDDEVKRAVRILSAGGMKDAEIYRMLAQAHKISRCYVRLVKQGPEETNRQTGQD